MCMCSELCDLLAKEDCWHFAKIPQARISFCVNSEPVFWYTSGSEALVPVVLFFHSKQVKGGVPQFISEDSQGLVYLYYFYFSA